MKRASEIKINLVKDRLQVYSIIEMAFAYAGDVIVLQQDGVLFSFIHGEISIFTTHCSIGIILFVDCVAT